MTAAGLKGAKEPTFYFVGVTTSKSSIIKIFPRWTRQLGLGEVNIEGIDCGLHDQPEVYRKVVSFIKGEPNSIGGLVTTHKMDLLEAARSQFEYLDPYAELLGEISSISKRGGELRGHAKDPISSGLALEAFVPAGYWRRTGAELCILGAGGSSLALSCYLMKQKSRDEWPARVVVTNRSPRRLAHMKAVHEKINPGLNVEYVLAESAAANDAVVGALKPGSLVANATGLGKDAEGSPLSDAVRFPEGGMAWEYNYRGNLVFLEQARAQEESRGLKVEDGWVYFIHGWTRVIAEVFARDIPTSGAEFDSLCRIAAESR